MIDVVFLEHLLLLEDKGVVLYNCFFPLWMVMRYSGSQISECSTSSSFELLIKLYCEIIVFSNSSQHVFNQINPMLGLLPEQTSLHMAARK